MRAKIQLLVMTLAGLFLASCEQQQPETKEVIRKVKISKVEKASEEQTRTFPGTINEAGSVNLAFRVAGPIKKIYVKEGRYVKKGELIAEIDPRDYQVQFNSAKAQYEQVKAEAERAIELHKRNSIADVDYEKATAGEKLVTAQLSHATDQLNDTKLYAPFSGYIEEVYFDDGEMINTGMPLANIIDVEHYEIEVDIPVSLFLQKDRFISYTCTSTVDPSVKRDLQLRSTAKKADNNQLYKLYFTMKPDELLVPGMNVSVSINYKNEQSGSFFIPVKAVFYEAEDSFVWIYDKETSTVKKQQVTTKELAGSGRARIISGLTGNEMIITAGVYTLAEGQKVDVLKSASKTNIGGIL